jgi:hypothetical protein
LEVPLNITFKINAAEKIIIQKGMNMRMSVQDNNRFFAARLSKWHELDEAIQVKLSSNEVNNVKLHRKVTHLLH